MIKSYLRVAIRNLLKHRTFSFINIFGLAVGLTGCMIIGLYIYEETGYDTFFPDHERVYRITREFKSPDGSTSLELAAVAPMVAPLLKNDYPQIEEIFRIVPTGSIAIKLPDSQKLYTETGFMFADSTMFEILPTPFVAGDPRTALSQPNAVVLSEEVAERYFGKQDPIGRSIELAGQATLQVTGVYKAYPNNTHMQPTMLASMALLIEAYGGEEAVKTNWGANSFFTYFKLAPGEEIAPVARDMESFLRRHLDERAPEWTSLDFQRLTDIHLYSQLDSEIGVNGDIKYVYTFAGISLLILLIACINYMNLSTARAATRAKEVGLRKVLGAYRFQLIRQFLAESILVVLISVVIAAVILSLVLPYFRVLTGNQFEINDANSIPIVISLVVIAIVIGIASGSYPAFFLSGFQASRVLKGELSTGKRASLLRQLLVVAQFGISVILIFSTVVIMQQVGFMNQRNLGFDQEEVVIIDGFQMERPQAELFRERLMQHPAITSVSFSAVIPSERLLSSGGSEVQVGNDMLKPDVVIKELRGDHQFIPVYDIPLAAGRNFDPAIQSDDTGAYLINASAAQMIGYNSPEDAIGKRMLYRGIPGQIIGVMEDIHFESLNHAIGPLVLHQRNDYDDYISIKLEAAATEAALGHLQSVWAAMQADVPYAYYFLDRQFQELYEAEQVRSSLFTGFSFLAILLACLGLLGLAAYTVSRRYKEINIRKVLGAPVSSLLLLLSREFIILVMISFAIAFPLGVYLMSEWLSSYAYRIALGPLPFIAAGVIALAAALLTVGAQTYKTANANPAEALRNE